MTGVRAQDTRARIVTATVELLRRRGYHAMGVKELTVLAGAPTGSLYHFFPRGKAQVAEAALRESGAAYQELFELIAGDAPDAAGAVTAFFDGAADALEEQDFVDLCPIGTVAAEVASSDDALRRAAADVFSAWTEALARRLRAEGASAPDADALATTVIAALEGGFVIARTTRDANPLRTTGRHLGELVRTFVRVG